MRTQDEAIGNAVSLMYYWGFPLRGVVLKAVSKAVSDIWARTLGEAGVRLAYERTAVDYTGRKSKRRTFSRISLKWRQARQPAEARSMTPVAIAKRILANGGGWDVPQLLGARTPPRMSPCKRAQEGSVQPEYAEAMVEFLGQVADHMSKRDELYEGGDPISDGDPMLTSAAQRKYPRFRRKRAS